MSLLLYVIALAGTIFLLGRRGGSEPVPAVEPSAARWAPLILGAVSAALSWWVWGSLRQVPVISDEAAYLFQAKLFAMGRWTAPTPPVPEFFEQANLLLSPVFASKYPPGHSLLLTPGVWVGLPGLVPVLLTGVTGALLFALARRLAGAWVAIIAWLLWTTSPVNVTFRPSYFSELSTCALFLASWWALLEWRAKGRRGWLVALAVVVAWAAITRPLTTAALALPIAVVVVRGVVVRRAWRDVAIAAAIGIAILAIIPVWSARTTGSWRTTPLTLHTREYLPFVHLGFGARSAAGARPQPPDMEAVSAQFQAIHSAHTVRALPETLTARTLSIGLQSWRGWRVLLLPFALGALLFVGAEGAFALLTALLLVGVYLLYAHPAVWTLYYLEIQPVLAFLTALGLVRSTTRLAEWMRMEGQPARRWTAMRALPLVVFVLLLPGAVGDARALRTNKSRQVSYQGAFRAALRGIGAEKAIVFVRYGPNHTLHYSLIDNEPDLARARVWTVYDRGADDSRLISIAPDREAFLFDEASHALVSLSPRTAGRD